MKQRASGSRRLPASAWVFDSALALVAAGSATALLVPMVVSVPVGRAVPGGMLALGCALVLLHTLPLAARRRFPGTVLALCVASGLAFAALFMMPVFLGPAILVAVYSVAAYFGNRWVSLAGLAVAEVGLAAVQLTPGKFERSTFLLFMGVIAVAWVLGRFVGDRQVYAAQLEERTAELEQAREELARRAVTEERLRLARELHDVVAHAMSVIAVQSGVGAHVAASRPEESARPWPPSRPPAGPLLPNCGGCGGAAPRQRAPGQPGADARPGQPGQPARQGGQGRAGGAGAGGRDAVAAASWGGSVGLPDRARGVDQRGQARPARHRAARWSATATRTSRWRSPTMVGAP